MVPLCTRRLSCSQEKKPNNTLRNKCQFNIYEYRFVFTLSRFVLALIGIHACVWSHKSLQFLICHLSQIGILVIIIRVKKYSSYNINTSYKSNATTHTYLLILTYKLVYIWSTSAYANRIYILGTIWIYTDKTEKRCIPRLCNYERSSAIAASSNAWFIAFNESIKIKFKTVLNVETIVNDAIWLRFHVKKMLNSRIILLLYHTNSS